MHISDGYSSPMYEGGTKEDALELVKHCKEALRENNTSCTVLTMTHGNFLNLIENVLECYNLKERIDYYFRNLVLSTDFTPRKFTYSPFYQPNVTGEHWLKKDFKAIDDPNIDMANFYALTKFHHFMTEPFDCFRVPFGIGMGRYLTVHPGNARIVSLDFLPKDRLITLFVCDSNPENERFYQAAISEGIVVDEYVFESLANRNLASILGLKDFHKVKVLFSSQVGLQIVEHHPALDEFAQEYVIEYDGINFIVNDVVIATYNPARDTFQFSKN